VSQDVDLHVVASNVAAMNAGSSHRLAVGEGPALIKEEPGVLIWTAQTAAGAPMVVKLYRNSRAREVRRTAFGGKRRVEREYEALAMLDRIAVPCTRPLFWGHGESVELGRLEVLATETVPNAVSGRVAIKQKERRAHLEWSRLFADIAKMHRQGLFHGRLGIKNILVDQAGSFTLLDFPQAMRFPFDLRFTRMGDFDVARVCKDLLGREDRARVVEFLVDHYGPRDWAERAVEYASKLEVRNGVRHKLRRLEFMVRRGIATRRSKLGPITA